MNCVDRALVDEQLDKLLTEAENLIPEEDLPDLPYMANVPDVHNWYEFEGLLWDLGEKIRLLVFENNIKFNSNQVDRIINICLDKKAKRGRQSFVMLLGKKCYCNYSEQIISILNDDDVDGHVIDTIYKMQSGQYVDQITPFLNHTKTWIRNKAKKYIEKYQS